METEPDSRIGTASQDADVVRHDGHQRRIWLTLPLMLAVGAGVLYVMLPLLLRAAVDALLTLVDGCVRMAAALSASPEPWTLASALLHVAGATLASQQVSLLLLAAATLATLAFYALQRALD